MASLPEPLSRSVTDPETPHTTRHAWQPTATATQTIAPGGLIGLVRYACFHDCLHLHASSDLPASFPQPNNFGNLTVTNSSASAMSYSVAPATATAATSRFLVARSILVPATHPSALASRAVASASPLPPRRRRRRPGRSRPSPARFRPRRRSLPPAARPLRLPGSLSRHRALPPRPLLRPRGSSPRPWRRGFRRRRGPPPPPSRLATISRRSLPRTCSWWRIRAILACCGRIVIYVRVRSCWDINSLCVSSAAILGRNGLNRWQHFF